MKKETEYLQNKQSYFNLEATFSQQLNIKSDNYFQYEKILHNSFIDKEQLMKRLSESDIKLYEENSIKKIQKFFRILQIKSTSSAFVYQFIISIYPFYTTVQILFQQQKSPFQNCEAYAFGNCGRIYLGYNEQKNEPFIIKEILFYKTQNWNQIFLSCLKQYMLALIMSALQVGPKIKKNFGFDIVVFSESIIFEMEYCMPKKFNKQAESDLKQNLAILHSFNIVHLDIKPMNIAFSNEFNKWVFIDFGFTQIIEQKIGYKTKTRYIGTFSFSSHQMKDCILGSNYVDLYYNDAFSLQQTISYCQKSQVSPEYSISMSFSVIDLNQRQIQRPLIEIQKKITLKYYLHKSDIKVLKKYFQTFGNKQLIIVAINFMSQSFPTATLKHFYYEYLADKIIDSQIKQYLDHKFKTNLKLAIESTVKPILQQKISLIQSFSKKILKNEDLIIKINNNIGQALINKEKIKKDRKSVLLNQTYVSEIQEDLYINLVFKYLTFRQNQFQAQLKDKQEVACFFSKKYKIQQQTYLGYDIQVPQLLSIVVCLQYIISYCEKQPYNHIKTSIYPEVCSEFVLVNPSIFTAKHPFNYFKYWSREVYKQNHSNLFKMLVNLLKIYSGFHFVNYRNDEINYDQSEIYNLQTVLQDIWKKDNYLEKHLKDKENIQKLRDFLKNVVKFTYYQEKKDILSFLSALVNDNFFEKSEQFQFQSKIRIGRNFLKFWDCEDKEKTYKIINQIYQNLNLQRVNQEAFHLCLCFQKIHDVFNCQQTINKIDKIINCPLISNRYLFMCRLYTNQFQESKQKITDYVQLQISNIKNCKSKNVYFYCDVIQTLNYLLIWPVQAKNNKTFRAKSNITQNQEILAKRIIKMNKQIILKVKKIVQNLMIAVQEEYNFNFNQQIQISTYYQLFKLIKSFLNYTNDNTQSSSFIYDCLQKLQVKFNKQPSLKFQKLKNQFRFLRIFSNCYNLFSKKEYFQSIRFLYEALIFNDNKNSFQIQINYQNNFQLLLIYVKYYNFYKPFQIRNQLSQNNCSKNIMFKDSTFLSKKKFIFETTQKQQINQRLQSFYKNVLNHLYLKLIKQNNFIETLRYDSPNFQILVHFYQQKQYQKFFNFLYTFTKYINTCPNSVTVYQVIQNLLTFKHFDPIITNQFFIQFQNHIFNKEKPWINPYWWIAASVITTWSTKCFKKILVNVAKSINFIIFYGKHQILKTLYRNCILLYSQNIPILKRSILINQSRKVIYLLKKHYKYFIQKKVNLQQHEAIKCPKQGFCIFNKLISKKIAIYHSNIQNIKMSKS